MGPAIGVLPRRRRARAEYGARLYAFALILFLAIMLLPGCGADAGQGADGGAARDAASAPEAAEEVPEPPEPPELPLSVSILCAGDVMAHKPQLAAHFDAASGLYNFSGSFQYVKGYVSAADLALCNLETTLGGEPYTGYPMFSSPDSLADALAGAGFDVAFTSNNHMLDRGGDGLRRTLGALRAAGLQTAGSQLEGERNYLVVSAGGIGVGVVSYTYESPSVNGRRTLNGIYIKDEVRPLVNSFGFEDLDGDLAGVEAAIDGARADGAEVVVCYFHWGNEYQRAPSDSQRYIASRAAIAGADIIFASHPHVLQGMEYLEPEPGRRVPVFYSMGNFVSNQRTETTGSMYTEQGMLAFVRLSYMKSSGEIIEAEATALPTWVDKYSSGGRNVYAIVPLAGDFAANPALAESGHYERAAAALEYCRELFGEGSLYE
ncbi:MAG: CapA family protein [Clostridiales Family XIII bacterium]|jgi:poly-gamma-glutamate synthesis protein (capsule biosynthesis protein)|nr:CapA family protein [Clostridiales Family XIII bacterium]